MEQPELVMKFLAVLGAPLRNYVSRFFFLGPDSHHDHGRALKQPSGSSSLAEGLIHMEETHVFWQQLLTAEQLLHGEKGGGEGKKNCKTHPESCSGVACRTVR